MAKYKRLFLSALVLLSLGISYAQATIIQFSTTQLSASRWRYDYTIHNDSLGAPLKEFTIFFREDLFANLSNESSLGGWDLLLVQPNKGIPAAGFLDGLDLAGGLAPGATLAGLSISFDYLGQGAPGQQRFSIVDPGTLQELDAGLTRAPGVIPLPGTLGLFGLGLLAAASTIRRQRGEK